MRVSEVWDFFINSTGAEPTRAGRTVLKSEEWWMEAYRLAEMACVALPSAPLSLILSLSSALALPATAYTLGKNIDSVQMRWSWPFSTLFVFHSITVHLSKLSAFSPLLFQSAPGNWRLRRRWSWLKWGWWTWILYKTFLIKPSAIGAQFAVINAWIVYLTGQWGEVTMFAKTQFWVFPFNPHFPFQTSQMRSLKSNSSYKTRLERIQKMYTNVFIFSSSVA